MATLSDLYDAIAAICPINGVEAGVGSGATPHNPLPIDWTSRATWKIDYDLSATAAQQIAAQQVLEAFDPAAIFQVTMRQARLALVHVGLYAQVQNTVAAADPATQVWWDYSDTVERANPILNAVAAQLGLTSAQVDALFKTAATL